MQIGSRNGPSALKSERWHELAPLIPVAFVRLLSVLLAVLPAVLSRDSCPTGPAIIAPTRINLIGDAPAPSPSPAHELSWNPATSKIPLNNWSRKAHADTPPIQRSPQFRPNFLPSLVTHNSPLPLYRPFINTFDHRTPPAMSSRRPRPLVI